MSKVELEKEIEMLNERLQQAVAKYYQLYGAYRSLQRELLRLSEFNERGYKNA